MVRSRTRAMRAVGVVAAKENAELAVQFQIHLQRPHTGVRDGPRHLEKGPYTGRARAECM